MGATFSGPSSDHTLVTSEGTSFTGSTHTHTQLDTQVIESSKSVCSLEE